MPDIYVVNSPMSIAIALALVAVAIGYGFVWAIEKWKGR